MSTYTIGSLFAGIGGLDLAAYWAGFETAWFVEKEPFCQKVLAKHWPTVPIYDDVFNVSYPPSVDVIVGGFPCQPFSVAGQQRGKDDERYLLPEMLRIVDEVKPYAVLFENVPGFPSLNDGAEFKYLLRALAEMGFDAEWGHLRAKDAGAPHTRERWFLVAYASGVGRNNGISNRGQRYLLHDFNGNAAQGKPEWQRWISRLGTASPVMAHTESADDRRVSRPVGDSPSDTRKQDDGQISGRSSQDVEHAQSIGGESGFVTQRHHESMGNTERSGLAGITWGRSGTQLEDGHLQSRRGQTQPGLGGVINGLPGRLDFCGFPAAIGQESYPYEPPRTAKTTTATNARIKALGNAVVPQCAYPIFAALMEWLQERDS